MKLWKMWILLWIILQRNEPEVVDFIFIFWLIDEWSDLLTQTEMEVQQIITTSMIEGTQKLNKQINRELKPISVTISTDNIPTIVEELVSRQFRLLDMKTRGVILNALNTGSFENLHNILENFHHKNIGLHNIMRIIRTEFTRQRSEIRLKTQKTLADQGILVKRRWMHVLASNNVVGNKYVPREDHIAMNGQLEDENGYFTSPEGNRTKAPRAI